MIILKGVIAIIAFLIVPELLGLFILKFWNKEKNNIILAFVLGYLIEFALGELVSVPMIFLRYRLYKFSICLCCYNWIYFYFILYFKCKKI
jgi:cation transporter-like permease